MSFIDPSKGIEGTVTSKQSLNAPIWVANTLLDYCGRELVEVDLP